MDFYEQILKNSEALLLEVDTALTKLTVETFRDAVKGTPSPANDAPYADGTLINNWYPALNSFSSESSSSKDDYGFSSLDRINSIVGAKYFYRKDSEVTLTNNISYAYCAEMLGWKRSDDPRWRNAPPYGMVANAMTNAKAKL